MSSTSFLSTATMRYWKKKTNATFGVDDKGLVQVVLLQLLPGQGGGREGRWGAERGQGGG